MNWNALKFKRCPKCDYRLDPITQQKGFTADLPNDGNFSYTGAVNHIIHKCENPECGFKISEARRLELTKDIPDPTIRRFGRRLPRDEEEGNLSALNNL